jgi:hypothetical protein
MADAPPPERPQDAASAAQLVPAPGGVAAVRLTDGRQRFVRDVPPQLPAGATIRFLLAGEAEQGVVSIPPALLIWCDPSVPCAQFLALERLPDASSAADVAPPLDLLLAEEGAPAADVLATMLALGHEEQGRLDDTGAYRPSSRSRDPHA